jgi:hypothetical protein
MRSSKLIVLCLCNVAASARPSPEHAGSLGWLRLSRQCMVKKQSLLSCSFSSASGKLCASESSWLQTSILMTLFTSDLFSNFPQRWQATKFRLLHLLIRSGKRCETTHCVRCNSNLEFSFVAKRVQRKSFYNTRDMDVLYISIDSLSHDSFSKFMQIMGKKTSI